MNRWKTRLLAGLLSLPALCAWGPAARAQVSVHIGIDFSTYPRLVRVPGYPVYYSPGAPANLFFYDGLYWLYLDDRWYASSWYNGPWSWVDPFDVPLFVLRVPVRYYPMPPPYFRPWRVEGPPHWGEHWGPEWGRRHPGWDRWDRRRAPPPAPLPVYQRAYRGERYPAPEEQRTLQQRQYHYRPREPVAQAHLEAPAVPKEHPVPSARDVGRRPDGPVAPPRRSESAPAPAAPAIPVPRPHSQEPERPHPLPQGRVDTSPPAEWHERGSRAERPVREAPVQRPTPPRAPEPRAPEPPRTVLPPTLPERSHDGGRGPERGHEQRRDDRGQERGRDR